jgi:hypothetical protein
MLVARADPRHNKRTIVLPVGAIEKTYHLELTYVVSVGPRPKYPANRKD